MKTLIFSFAFTFISVLCYSQRNIKVDSLLNKLNYIQEDTEKVNLLLKVGDELIYDNPKKAIEYYNQGLLISKQIKNDLLISNSLEAIGLLYTERITRFDTAKIILHECLKIRRDNLGELNPATAEAYGNLAMAYEESGEYEIAESHYLQAYQILNKTLSADNPRISSCLNNLAGLYLTMGNNNKAELFYLQALQIRKKYSKSNFRSYAKSLNNLAVLYKSINNYKKADSLYLEAIQVYEKENDINNPEYASTLSNLANLNLLTEKYEQVEPLLLKAINITKNAYGENHSQYGTALNNFAGYYYSIGNYEKAEPLLIKSMLIKRNVLGEYHPEYAQILHNLAGFYFRLKQLDKAEPYFIENITLLYNDLLRSFSFLSESEKESYLYKNAWRFGIFYYYALNRKIENPEITRMVYDNVIKCKGVLLKSSSALRTSVLNSNNTELISLYEQWINLKKEMSETYQTKPLDRKMSLHELESQVTTIEKKLAKESRHFNDFEKIKSLNWESIKNELAPGEAAIEFIRFLRSRDKFIYCALIITSESKSPAMELLFDEENLVNILEKRNTYDDLNISELYGTNLKIQDTLYKLIWFPIEKHLKGIQTVYFSPDGLLHKLSFAAIGNDSIGLLCQKFKLLQLSSTANVVKSENFCIEKNSNFCIIGGVEYSKDNTNYKVWDYLPGTKSETDKINYLFKKNRIRTNYFNSYTADEKVFKNSAEKANLIHIATHGFYYPNYEDVKKDSSKYMRLEHYYNLAQINSYGKKYFLLSENPLMRSGVALANANEVWNKDTIKDVEDGVLTAYEVSNMNLQNTHLVVLSACETGLGDIIGSEGVYGLQRAFKMAGVKYIIMSLWQVPDKETVEFMTTFYTKLLKQKDIRKAFTETQNEMRKKYDPYYWAAFVLVE